MNTILELNNQKGIAGGEVYLWGKGVEWKDEWLDFVFQQKKQTLWFPPTLPCTTELQSRNQQWVRVCVCLISHIWEAAWNEVWQVEFLTPALARKDSWMPTTSWMSCHLNSSNSWGAQHFLTLRCATGTEKNYIRLLGFDSHRSLACHMLASTKPLNPSQSDESYKVLSIK